MARRLQCVRRARLKHIFALMVVLTMGLWLTEFYYLQENSTDDVDRPASTSGWKSDVIGDQHLNYVTTVDMSSCDKWIVLDTTQEDCVYDYLQALETGWNMLIVGDETFQISGCDFPNCTVFPDPTVTLSAEIGVKPTRTLWKNLAYLIAMSRGAVHILDATECSAPLAEVLRVLEFTPHNREHGLMYNETLLFNPYSHFGAWASVPRAMATETVTENSRMYYVRDFRDAVLVKHAVSHTSSDVIVGGVSDETRSSGSRPGGSFDSSAPPVFVGQRTFSAGVPAYSVYRKRSFWAMLLPCTSPSLRCDVLRLYVTQRLFRELDAFSGYYQLATFPEKTGQGRYSDSIEGRVTATHLANVLDSWDCPSSDEFFECFENVANHLFDKYAVSEQEQLSMKSWVSSLRGLCVPEPPRVRTPWRGVRKTSEVRVTLGYPRSRYESSSPEEKLYLRERFVKPVEDRCPDFSWEWYHKFETLRKPPEMEDVVLVVLFNTNQYFWHNLPFLETTHRPFFKNIVYCVQDIDQLLEEDEDGLLDHVSLIEEMSDEWFLHYECITSVVRMRHRGVKGYLHVGDDTLLNTWLFSGSSRDRLLLTSKGTIISAQDGETGTDWLWWNSVRGRYALLNAMAGLEHLSGLSQEQLSDLNPSFRHVKMHRSYYSSSASPADSIGPAVPNTPFSVSPPSQTSPSDPVTRNSPQSSNPQLPNPPSASVSKPRNPSLPFYPLSRNPTRSSFNAQTQNRRLSRKLLRSSPHSFKNSAVSKRSPEHKTPSFSSTPPHQALSQPPKSPKSFGSLPRSHSPHSSNLLPANLTFSRPSHSYTQPLQIQPARPEPSNPPKTSHFLPPNSNPSSSPQSAKSFPLKLPASQTPLPYRRRPLDQDPPRLPGSRSSNSSTKHPPTQPYFKPSNRSSHPLAPKPNPSGPPNSPAHLPQIPPPSNPAYSPHARPQDPSPSGRTPSPQAQPQDPPRSKRTPSPQARPQDPSRSRRTPSLQARPQDPSRSKRTPSPIQPSQNVTHSADEGLSLGEYLQRYPGFQQLRGMSPHQLTKVHLAGVRRAWSSDRPVATFSALLSEWGAAAESLLRLILDGSQDWQKPSPEESMRFLERYYQHHNMAGLAEYFGVDFFYLPSSMADDFVRFSHVFLSHGVMVELAVPALHYGIAERQEVTYVQGSELWDAARNYPWAFYNRTTFYLHPFKLKEHLDEEEAVAFYCQGYLNSLFYLMAQRDGTHEAFKLFELNKPP